MCGEFWWFRQTRNYFIIFRLATASTRHIVCRHVALSLPNHRVALVCKVWASNFGLQTSEHEVIRRTCIWNIFQFENLLPFKPLHFQSPNTSNPHNLLEKIKSENSSIYIAGPGIVVLECVEMNHCDDSVVNRKRTRKQTGSPILNPPIFWDGKSFTGSHAEPVDSVSDLAVDWTVDWARMECTQIVHTLYQTIDVFKGRAHQFANCHQECDASRRCLRAG